MENDIQDFDQPDYFDHYERCNKLDPSHYDFQESNTYFTSPYHSRNEKRVDFSFVQVENQYILRICQIKAGMYLL